MRVKLKVLKGSKAGTVWPVNGHQLLIGRGEDCDLRPRNDNISRRHCVIRVTDSQILVQDLGSKNGTFINGERIASEQGLKAGDTISVGPIAFEVIIDAKSADKRPEAKNVEEVVQRTAEDSVSDFDVSSWLEEADEAEREKRLSDPETRQYKLDETDRVPVDESTSPSSDTSVDEEQGGKNGGKIQKRKKEAGKLPRLAKQQPKDSRQAAQDMLKKFFTKG